MLAPLLAAATFAAPSPHARFVRRANAICDSYQYELVNPPGDVGGGDLGDPKYDAAWVSVFDQFATALTRLQPPAADVRKWKRLLAYLPTLRAAAVALMQSVESGAPEDASMQAFALDALAWQEAHRRALAVGATHCFADDS